MMETERTLRALVTLLNEQTEEITIVREKLVEFGETAIPMLKEVIARDDASAKVRSEAIRVIEEIRLARLSDDFKDFSLSSDPSIEEGALLLARFRYPDLDQARYRARLDHMGEELAQKIEAIRAEAPHQPARELVDFLYGTCSFRGNSSDYYDPDNSYLNRVLERKKGVPISLAALYLSIARRLSIPLYGVGLPGHFLIGYSGPEPSYIDPFNGLILERDEIVRSFAQSGVPFQDGFLAETGPKEMLVRMMRNLISIYSENGEPLRVNWLSRFCALFAGKG